MKAIILMGVFFCWITAFPAESNDTYVIEKGDSVATICLKFQIPAEELLASNPGLNPARLAIGQRVKISTKTNSANRADTGRIPHTGSTSQNSTSKSEASAEKRTSSSMYPITAQDKTFLEQIQKAVSTNDVEWLSEVVSYPLTLKQHDKNITLKNSSDFKKYSASILTPYLKSAVQNQSPDSLFKNWRGVMIGGGVIWFSAVKEKTEDDWTHRIIGVNPENRSAEKEKPISSEKTSSQKLKP